MTKDQLIAAALRYHKSDPGCWLQTDREMTDIIDVVRDATKERPRDERNLNTGLWWRTHDLLAQLGHPV